jgi:maleylpyruvate isomerase
VSGTDVATSMPWLRDGTTAFLAQLDAAELAAASLLPGWTNGHVAAHVARNADALIRLLHWAKTGEQTPMYASQEARNAEIERDAVRPPDVQRADVRATAAALEAAIAGCSDETWTVRVRTSRAEISAGEVPWMRVKEVWLHGIDLGAPAANLPVDVSRALADDIAQAFSRREDAPPMRIVDADSGHVVEIGDGGVTVTGAASELAIWLAGRSSGDRLHCPAGLPVLPAWL